RSGGGPRDCRRAPVRVRTRELPSAADRARRFPRQAGPLRGGAQRVRASGSAHTQRARTRAAARARRQSQGVLMSATNGKICYVEMPAVDIRRSADFYSKVFGWQIRRRGDGATAFDDTTGQVSGSWVVGRPAAAQPGLLIYIMVDSVAATIETVVAHGGVLVQPIGADAPEITARFRDPGGNVIGLYQEPAR